MGEKSEKTGCTDLEVSEKEGKGFNAVKKSGQLKEHLHGYSTFAGI